MSPLELLATLRARRVCSDAYGGSLGHSSNIFDRIFMNLLTAAILLMDPRYFLIALTAGAIYSILAHYLNKKNKT